MSEIIHKSLEGLNEEQFKLAQHVYGPCLGVAGPGSGKTHTVVSRVAYMIESGIHPDNILMFSFTKKAAGEMKERIVKRIESAGSITVGTYHSFCARVLRQYAHHINFERNFSIYDPEDCKKLLKEIANDPFYKPDMMLSMISDWKSKMIAPVQAEQEAPDRFHRIIAGFYREYQKRLHEQNAMDFDDLIGHTITLLQNTPSVKKALNDRYKFITTDETQDSSRKDIELIRLLAGDDMNICMIMDDCQSIYGFRGADIEAVLNMATIFPGLVTYLLQQNYRSTSTIVNASMNLIAHNRDQIEKEIFTKNEDGEEIVVMSCASQQDEANRITRLIKGLTKEHYNYKDIAILYRLSYVSRAIEEALLANSIPYTIIGGTPFYARKEVKDVMGYIRLLHNKRDKQAFERIINLPKRSLGPKTVETIIEISQTAEHAKTDLVNVCQSVELKGKAKTGIANFNEVMCILTEIYESGCSPAELIEAVMDTINYEQYLLSTESDAEDRLANLIELKNIATQYDTVDDFIYNMSLNSLDTTEEEAEDKVQLLTMHASKGLEFPAVIVAAANEGVVPSFRATTQKQIDEERRLFYVAVSRAEKLLFITRPKISIIQGQSQYTKESRFIEEMGEAFLMRI